MLKYLPSYIATFNFLDSLIRRQLVITLDDIIFIMLHIMTRHVALQLPKQEVLSPAKYNSTPPTDEKKEGIDGNKDDQNTGEED